MNDTSEDPFRNHPQYPELLPINARHLQTMNSCVVFTASTALSLLLLIALATEKSPNLKAYSNVLMLNCGCDFYYTAVSFITDFQMEVTNGHIVLVLAGVYRNASYGWHFLGLEMWLIGMYLSMFIIPVVCYFRYSLVVRNVMLNGIELLRLFTLPIIASIGVASLLTLACAMESVRISCDEELWHPLWHHNGANVRNCMIADVRKPLALLYTAVVGVTNCGIYAMMAYFTVGIFRAIRQAKCGPKTARLHRQMNALLVVQLLLPVFCACMPMSTAVVLAFGRSTVHGLGIAIVMFVEWIPLANPLVILIFVGQYRRRLVAGFGAVLERLWTAATGSGGGDPLSKAPTATLMAASLTIGNRLP